MNKGRKYLQIWVLRRPNIHAFFEKSLYLVVLYYVLEGTI